MSQPTARTPLGTRVQSTREWDRLVGRLVGASSAALMVESEEDGKTYGVHPSELVILDEQPDARSYSLRYQGPAGVENLDAPLADALRFLVRFGAASPAAMIAEAQHLGDVESTARDGGSLYVGTDPDVDHDALTADLRAVQADVRARAPRRFTGDEDDLMGHLSTNALSVEDVRHLDSVKGWLQYAESSSPVGLRFLAAELRVLAGSFELAAERAS